MMTIEGVRKAFPIRLRALMATKQISQAELAKVLQLSRSTICFWVNGTFLPNIVDFLNLANYFNCSLDSLMADIDTEGEKRT